MAHSQINRRSLLQYGAGLAAALACAEPIWAAASQKPLSKDIALLQELGDITIPTTDTPGAGSVETAQFVSTAIEHGLLGAPADTLAVLSGMLDQAVGGPFLSVPRKLRIDALSRIDSRATSTTLSDGQPEMSWLATKRLIVLAYYTSEIGASKELQYELVPGEFVPDKPALPDERAPSSNWMGNSAL